MNLLEYILRGHTTACTAVDKSTILAQAARQFPDHVFRDFRLIQASGRSTPWIVGRARHEPGRMLRMYVKNDAKNVCMIVVEGWART